jgi:hypothetical protein
MADTIPKPSAGSYRKSTPLTTTSRAVLPVEAACGNLNPWLQKAADGAQTPTKEET